MAMSFRTVTQLMRRLQAWLTGRGNLHFLHIRKTGGTAIKSALLPLPVTPGWVIYLHPHRVTLARIPRRHQVMFVTRDPVSRFVSGFNSRLRQGKPAHDVPWTAEEAIAFRNFTTPEQLALALDPAHPQHDQARHAMRSITHIHCSYWDWFGSEQALDARRDSILFIGRTESLDADFAQLRAVLQLPAGVVLPDDERATNRSAPSGRGPALSPAAIALIRQWYADDYRFVAWCDAWRSAQGGPVNRKFLPSGNRTTKE